MIIILNKYFVYDPKNKKMRAVVVRSCTFQLIAAFILLMLIPLLSSLIFFFLTLPQNEKLVFPWALFLGFTLQIVIVMAIVTPVLYLTQGRQKIEVSINDEKIMIDSCGTFGINKIEINNIDIKKVYVPIYCKMSLWKKYVGYYPIYCQAKKVINNGEVQTCRKGVSRNIYLTEYLEETDEIIAFFQNTSRRQR